MATAMLGRVCSVCRQTLTRLTGVQTHINSGLHKRLASRSALPPVSEIVEEDLAEYEVSKDDFKFVEDILPPKVIPSVPHHDHYPTPSGWYPPREEAKSLPYFVRRTKNHMLPMYEELRNGNTRKMVKIRNIDGDIWAFDTDLRAYLQEKTGRKIIASQVHEVGGYIRVKGLMAEHVCQFLLDKGF
ncbi:large ribosomal subunit protein mL49-like [Babylonia areolata]|uniref:large ribosomal subunit protein mL49-like n=1 Tax=Babylonia areolata TaxID=304850 RepID=UPI003FCFEE7C